MKRLMLAAVLIAAATPALADGACQYGTAGIFDFIGWSFKMTEDKGMEVSVTFHNNLDKNLSWYEMHIELGERMFGVSSEVPVKARGDATAVDYMGMPQKDADLFKPMTPVLCAIGVRDDKGEHTSYY